MHMEASNYSNEHDPGPTTGTHSPTLPRIHLTAGSKWDQLKKTPASTDINNNSVSSVSSENDICLIMRDDKKPLPFNFVNISSPSWSIFKLLNLDSLERNQKGTVIKATIKKDQQSSIAECPSEFLHKDIRYICKFPRPYSSFIGEVTFDLNDIDDKSILTIPEEQLIDLIKLPSNSGDNIITKVRKIFPRKVLDSNIDKEKIVMMKSMSISIECATAVPSRIFFENASIYVKNYIIPPTRCYNCQRFGHGAVSCRRPIRCARCGDAHSISDCKSEPLRCISCKGPHAAHSYKCPFFKEALKIAARVQEGLLNREKAVKMYSEMYNTNKTFKSKPAIMPTQSSQSSSFTSQPKDFPSIKPSSRDRQSATQTVSPSIQTPDSSWLRSITPGQCVTSRTTQPNKKRKSSDNFVSPHQTKEYADILDGSSWAAGRERDDYDYEGTQIPCGQTSQKTTSDANEEESLFSLVSKIISKSIQWIINNLLPKSITESPFFSSFIKTISSFFSQDA